jgi:hypothetical protein
VPILDQNARHIFAASCHSERSMLLILCSAAAELAILAEHQLAYPVLEASARLLKTAVDTALIHPVLTVIFLAAIFHGQIIRHGEFGSNRTRE